MNGKKGYSKLLATKNFGILIGAIVFLLMVLISYRTVLISNLELKVLDFNFRLKNVVRERRVQEGVTVEQRNPNISPDILILGIDDKSLSKYGKWPFPRYREANLVNAFSRIVDQGLRERALFLDIFFIEPDRIAEDDALLVNSIADNERVFLETVLTREENTPGTAEEFLERQMILNENYGIITNISGDWTEVNNYRGVLPPLKPYARATHGYGHAVFEDDEDETFRRQPLVVRLSKILEEIRFADLTPETPLDRENFERFSWVDMDNIYHDVPFPLTKKELESLGKELERRAPLKAEDSDGDGEVDQYYYVIRKYQDYFLPAITLSLACEYFNKSLSDLEIVLGEHIRIPEPMQFNVETQAWEPYQLLLAPAEYDEEGVPVKEAEYEQLDEILIPINEEGEMLINFMGIASSASPQGHQTFPVRSFSGYADRAPDPDRENSVPPWPPSLRVQNYILMVGPFSKGIAEDEKPTPYGLMYGVEIHANAFNTIIMKKFLNYIPTWTAILILLGLTLLTAFMVSRLPIIWSLVVSFGLIIIYFFVVSFTFELYNTILNLSAPTFSIVLSLIAVIAYRIMTEEKDKQRIRMMFGKYVSPAVVEEILENPPELGGVDKELTVFFSDIRGFTTLSEAMTPQELVNHLNEYLTAMTDIILDYKGTLDKYVGDEIMCFWGAPLPQEEHAILACKCALKQMQVLSELNEQWPPERKINIGIGLNSGIMTVGNMGSMGRMNYTLTGDEVNLGARLEGTNKQYLTNIIISESTYGHVKEQIVARELDNIRVKGKNKPVLIYELVDVIDGLGAPVAAEKE